MSPANTIPTTIPFIIQSEYSLYYERLCDIMWKNYHNLNNVNIHRSIGQMTKLVENTEEKIIFFIRNYGKYIYGSFFIGILTYFMMMSQNLVNDTDGIWHLSNFIAGDWEISLGRGLQRYADRARFGIVSDSFNSMITILLFAIANTMILTRFDFDNFIYKGLWLIILMANPVICNTLSYSYMSVNFGLAYFFSVVAFLCIRTTIENWKKAVIWIFAGAAFLGISMAFYQAYICSTSVLVIMSILRMLLKKENTKKVLQYIGLCLSTFVIGGVVYLLITKTLLYRADIQMASYKGASGIDLWLMLKYLPQSLKQCYSQFLNYFFIEKASSNLEFIDVVLAGLFIVYFAAAIIQFIKLLRHRIISSILFAITVILLPVASCSILLIAVGNSMTGLMAMGVVMCFVMLGILIPGEGKSGFWLKRIYLLFLIAFAWFQLSAVINDQLALKEGKTATITLTENIITQLYSEGYLDQYQTVAFVGRPGNNNGFSQSTAYQMANGYAHFGCWSTDARNNRVSWEGVISNFLGVNLNLCGDIEYQEIVTSEQVADMPEFPSKGSICVIDDIVVVKVSELY